MRKGTMIAVYLSVIMRFLVFVAIMGITPANLDLI